ncbi:MAG: hypothetical protein ABMA26_25110, partial [Limisphaerales bacterium]
NFETYAVLTLAGLLPWQFFANAMGESSNSLVGSSNMISKIYFPRLIIPASAVISGAVDFAIGLVILFGVMLWAGVSWHLNLLLLPVFFLVAFAAAFAIGLWLSALNVNRALHRADGPLRQPGGVPVRARAREVRRHGVLPLQPEPHGRGD